MVAYTNYATDPRVMREAEALQKNNIDVDFLCLKRKSELKTEIINGVKVIRLNQQRYRGNSQLFYIFGYFQFFIGYFLKVIPYSLKNSIVLST